ncbi:structure-specific endonuclease subunit SLX4 [Condylostylus longicornis]|uniref:structure-specific endonuclease subunit SLX4 n=1 Tax=Condylostylus longicornis TaxID=2530218 RepID=UPI00244DF2D4|nr:structure-specific endonuclease subunit SLX4 [Condylostylus longicornis]
MINKEKLNKLKLTELNKRNQNQVSKFFSTQNTNENDESEDLFRLKSIESKAKHLLRETESALNITEDENQILSHLEKSNEQNNKNSSMENSVVCERKTVISKFFDSNFDDFQSCTRKERKTTKTLKEKLIKKKTSSKEKKKQTTIKSAFAKNEEVFSELMAQHSIAENFDPEDMQVALACSMSEAEIPSLNSESNDNLTCTSKNVDKIREKLEQYGFRINSNKEDYDINYFLPKSIKKAKWANRFTSLTLRCPKKQNQKLHEKIEQFLSTQFSEEENCEESPFQFNISSPYLETLIPEIDTIKFFRKGLYMDNENDDVEIFYVSELFEPRKSKPGSLLKNFKNIPGRDLSPVRNMPKVPHELEERKYSSTENAEENVQCIENENNKNYEISNIKLATKNTEITDTIEDENAYSIQFENNFENEMNKNESLKRGSSESSPDYKRPKLESFLAEIESKRTDRADSPDIFNNSEGDLETSATKNDSTELDRIHVYEKFSSDEAKVSDETCCNKIQKHNKSQIEISNVVDLTQSDESMSEIRYEQAEPINKTCESPYYLNNEIHKILENCDIRNNATQNHFCDNNFSDKNLKNELDIANKKISTSTKFLEKISETKNEDYSNNKNFKKLFQNDSKSLTPCFKPSENINSENHSNNLQNDSVNEFCIISSEDEDTASYPDDGQIKNLNNSNILSKKKFSFSIHNNYMEDSHIIVSDDNTTNSGFESDNNLENIEVNLHQYSQFSVATTPVKHSPKNLENLGDHLELGEEIKNEEFSNLTVKQLSASSQSSDLDDSCIILSDDEVNYSILTSAKKNINKNSEIFKNNFDKTIKSGSDSFGQGNISLIDFCDIDMIKPSNIKLNDEVNNSHLEVLEENLSDSSNFELKLTPENVINFSVNKSLELQSPLKNRKNATQNENSINQGNKGESFIISDVEDEDFDLNVLRKKYGLPIIEKKSIPQKSTGCRKSLSESFSKNEAITPSLQRFKTFGTHSINTKKFNNSCKEIENEDSVISNEFDEIDKLIYGSPNKCFSLKNERPSNFENLLTAKINRISPIKLNKAIEPFEFENGGKIYLIKTQNIEQKPDFKRMNSPTRIKYLYNYGLKPLKRKQAIIMLEHIYNQTHPILENFDSNTKIETEIKIENENLNFQENIIETDYIKKVENDNCKIFDGNHLNLKDYFWDEIDISEEKLIFDDKNEESYIFQTNTSKKVSTALLPFHIAWFNLFRSNLQLREAIFHFEPIDLQEIYNFFKSIGYRYDPRDIKKFLDEKCIIFRYDVGNNNVNRHKRKNKT